MMFQKHLVVNEKNKFWMWFTEKEFEEIQIFRIEILTLLDKTKFKNSEIFLILVIL